MERIDEPSNLEMTNAFRRADVLEVHIMSLEDMKTIKEAVECVETIIWIIKNKSKSGISVFLNLCYFPLRRNFMPLHWPI